MNYYKLELQKGHVPFYNGKNRIQMLPYKHRSFVPQYTNFMTKNASCTGYYQDFIVHGMIMVTYSWSILHVTSDLHLAYHYHLILYCLFCESKRYFSWKQYVCTLPKYHQICLVHGIIIFLICRRHLNAILMNEESCRYYVFDIRLYDVLWLK